MGWLLTTMMLLYPIHACIVVRADLEFARQHPESQFNLRAIVMHDTVFGWAGAWGAALGIVWLAVAIGLWIYYRISGGDPIPQVPTTAHRDPDWTPRRRERSRS
jgi:hypothetical protein